MTLVPYSSLAARISHFFIAAALVTFGARNFSGQVAVPAPPPSPLPAPSYVPYVATMTFDVASVRASKPDMTKGFFVGGGFTGSFSSLNMTNSSVSNMFETAFGLSSYQIAGLPGWTNGAMYNVQAKSDDVANEKLATLTPEQVRLEQEHMMQVLLEDRFKLKTHWATRAAPVYYLVVSKGGPKMHAGGTLPALEEEIKAWGSQKMPEIHQRGDGRRGYEFIGHECHTAALAETLGSMMETDVIDKTGLAGTYDFDLQYSQASDAEREANPTIWPSIPDAVEKQLGLKMQRLTGTVRILIVDHLERPSEN